MGKSIATKKILNSLYGEERKGDIIEITRVTVNGIVHLLIAENKEASVSYTYQVYNTKNKTEPLVISFDLYNKLLELFATKSFKNFKVENYIIINGVKWENIENINITTLGEVISVIDDALSHGFSFLVHNYKLYYKDEEE